MVIVGDTYRDALRLVRFAAVVLKKDVLFSQAPLDRAMESWAARPELLITDIYGICQLDGPIVIKPSLEGDMMICTIAHEIGHAIDFLNVERIKLWYDLWGKPVWNATDRKKILSYEENADKYGWVVIRNIGVRVSEETWRLFVENKMPEDHA